MPVSARKRRANVRADIARPAASASTTGHRRGAPRPRPARLQRRPPAGPQRGLDVLGLPAVAVRRHDHAAGDAVGGGRAVVAADEVQAQVDAGRGPGAGEDAVVLDVEDVGHDLDERGTRRRSGRRRSSASSPAARRAGRLGPARTRRCTSSPRGRRGRWRRQGRGQLLAGGVVQPQRGDDDQVGARAGPGGAAPPGRSRGAYAAAPARGEHTAKSNQGSPWPRRSMPNTSQATANSNGEKPSSTTTATSRSGAWWLIPPLCHERGGMSARGVLSATGGGI